MTLNKRLIKGNDCREEFQKAYENRYTWHSDFAGYKGICTFEKDDFLYQGEFCVDAAFNINVKGIQDDSITKSIASQLWEVVIHRIYRPFQVTHGENSFNVGDFNDVGMEIIVGGKNKGDIYRIKDNIVTMVYRHIHGKVINIFTQETINTERGYLSKKYTSQYFNSISGEPENVKNIFIDEFTPLFINGPWVLSKRSIESVSNNSINHQKQIFSFTEFSKL